MPSHCGVRALTEKFGGYNLVHVVDVQSSRHDSLDCSIPGLPVPHHLPNLPKSMSTASVKAFRHLILWCPLLLLPSIFPSIRDFSNESSVCNVHAMNMNLGKFREMVKDRETWCAAAHGIAKRWTQLGNWTTAIRLVYSDNESLEKESLKSERNVRAKSSRRQKEMVSLTMLGWIVGVERVKDRSLWVGSRWQAPLKGRGGGGLLEQELKREG